uniref:Protein msta, isoform A n=2 Tax=Lygus hesperus TaxID=30085 RepID=A0A146L8D6_LYGHE
MSGLLVICNNDKVGSDILDGTKYPTRSTLRSCRRFAKVKKNVKAGEELLNELPFVVGPKLDTPLCCLGCYHYMEDVALCEKCRWPVCSPECSKTSWHCDYECDVLKQAGVEYNVEGDPGPQLESITPLRALLASEKDLKRWESEVVSLMDHNSLRKENQEVWEAERINVVEFLRNRCKLSERFSEDLIRKVCGILEVNSYEILPDTVAVPIRGLYPTASIPSHNCVANTTHSISPGDFKMVMRATIDLAEGSEVLCSYTSSLDPTMIRRAALRCSKYFECDCDRCRDPTELGSHLSSIKCPSCDNGLILSSDPLDAEAIWKCTHCDKTLAGQLVQRLYLKIQNEVAELEYMDVSPEKLELAEKVLRNYKSSLHPRHAFNVSVFHILTQLYGRVDGYTMDMLPDILLERKAEFGQRILDALAIVEPGMTRMRGRLLFELHAAYLMMSRTKLQLKVITLEKFKDEINRVIAMLEESSRILELEPTGSLDAHLAQNAKESIEQLRTSIDSMTELPE